MLIKQGIKKGGRNFARELLETRLIKKQKVAVNIVLTMTTNNVFITVLGKQGKVLIKSSSGHMKLQRKRAPLPVEMLGMYVGKHMQERGFTSYALNIIGHFNKVLKNTIREIGRASCRERV